MMVENIARGSRQDMKVEHKSSLRWDAAAAVAAQVAVMVSRTPGWVQGRIQGRVQG